MEEYIDDITDSEWYDIDYEHESENSSYCIGIRSHKVTHTQIEAVFHLYSNTRISQWHGSIRLSGLLIDDSSDYYVALQDINRTDAAIFHKDYPDEPISKWHELIGEIGLINNTSQCYVAKAYNSPYFQVYHVNNPDIPVYELPFTNIGIEHILHVNSGFTVLCSNDNLVIYSAISNQIEKIAKLPSEFASRIKRARQYGNAFSPWEFYYQDILIAKHIQDGFIPVILGGEGIIYNTKGEILEQYDVRHTDQAAKYATQFIKEYKEKHNSINMIAP